MAPLWASVGHFWERMILVAQSMAEGIVTFYADTCHIEVVHELQTSCFKTQCP